MDLLASNLTLLTVPPPGSGAVLAAILNIMQVPAPLTSVSLCLRHYITTLQNYPDMNQTSALFYHRLVESFKWAYGARTRLGDPSDPEYGPGVAATVIRRMIVMMMMIMTA